MGVYHDRYWLADTYTGLPIVDLQHVDDDEAGDLDAAGTAWRLWTYDDEDFAEHLRRFLLTVDTGRVRAILVQEWGQDTGSEVVVEQLAEHAAELPGLRSIFLASESEHVRISWIRHGDVTPLLEAFPALERLDVRGNGPRHGGEGGLRFRPVRHESLRMLRFESGGLSPEIVRAVGESDLPALEHLDLWLGRAWYGGGATPEDLSGVLRGDRLPALRHLGVRNSEIQDEMAAAVVTAPVVPRLRTLGLGLGTLTDRGAESLLSGHPLTHLTHLDLAHHYLTGPMMDRVRQALPGVEVNLNERRSPGPDSTHHVAVSG
ncbi:leucine-rich repeat domain-containing protein [Bailinhaonella thermotolerans]|uniref:Leucine-rich repeat domain-containing protein n=2 Tax=Bailinhaonella thermotolerans TaxID=1070861 RepID=A0A3A4BLD6_9ACTN|nr:leucine-rich repeat domain-containing protein [Bailinhaonella thermotolerans]